ncbi:MAG: hypothetical protein FJ137_00865 [Deltaproteobacteria bacterium]|nr:hypothetical protein [Deltaproteobacteria bacterium]
MRPFVLVASLSALVSPPGARAAGITEVADAAEEDNPIDIAADVSFDILRHTGVITRENTQPAPEDPDGAPRTANVKELAYERLRYRLKPRLEVGVFRDLSLFTEWPVILWDAQTTQFTDGTTSANSTLTRDLAPNASPTVDDWPQVEGAGNNRPEIQEGTGVDTAFGFPKNGYNNWRVGADGTWAGYRRGLDNPTFGLRWSPTSNHRDETKPTITLQADYTAPFFDFMDPTTDALEDPASPGPVANGLHRFHFSVAMSKRVLLLDPYFLVEYTIPFTGGRDQHLLGMFPRQNGAFIAGLEIVPYEDRQRQQKVAFEVQAMARYFSEGRDYSEVSDLFREQTYTDQFLRTGGEIGFVYSALRIVSIDLRGVLNYDTEHFLTIEDFGRDLDDANDKVDLRDPAERNVYFNPALDTVGRRLRIEQSLLMGFQARVSLTF